MPKYLHPSVESNIIDNSMSFVSSEGVNKLFVTFTADKGEDNELKTITSPTEWIFNYGEPNYRKHGQAPYNALEWLKSGGDVVALRVMPDNAGYSNMNVNVQTRTKKKEVLDSEDELVTVDDVEVRTVTTCTDVNNNSEGALENELERDYGKTVDGFKNHKLLTVKPKGRGKEYNNLGFRLTLNNSLNGTYNFRLYDFQVVKYKEDGSVANVESSLTVSLDPDATSQSGESMFIEYRVNKYSDYLTVEFNEDAYDELGKVINPNVNPNRLDLINLQEREEDTFYSDVTGQEESIYMYVNEYYSVGPNKGQPTGSKNIVDSDNTIQESIVDIDNTVRKDVYKVAQQKIDNMKKALVKIDQGNYTSELNEQLDTAIGSGDSIDTLLTNLEDSFEELETNINEDNDITPVIDDIKSIINNIIDESRAIVDFAQAGTGTTPDLLEAIAGIKTLLYRVEDFKLMKVEKVEMEDIVENQVDITDMPTDRSEYLSEVEDVVKKLTEVKNFVQDKNVDETDVNVEELEFDNSGTLTISSDTDYTVEIEINGSTESISYTSGTSADLSSLVSGLNTELKSSGTEATFITEQNEDTENSTISLKLVELDEEFTIKDVTESGTSLINDGVTINSDVEWNKPVSLVDVDALNNEFTTLLKKLDKAQNENFPESIKDSAYDEIKNNGLDNLYTTVSDELDNVIEELELIYALDFRNLVDSLYVELTGVQNVISNASPTLETADTYIEEAKTDVSDARLDTYRHSLHDFNEIIRLSGGKDGDLRMTNDDGSKNTERPQVIKNLLIEGYEGMIDNNLNNKKLYPIDLVLDANYDTDVKSAIITLCKSIRRDFIGILDTKLQADPEQAVNYRQNKLTVDSHMLSIFTQDLIVYDEYTGQDIRVTSPFFLSGKIPTIDENYGIQYPFVGPQRGTISGFKSLSFNPNKAEKENLYKNQINYIQKDPNQTRFNSQLTSQSESSALSNINNVRVLMKIQRAVELMGEKYQFEFFNEAIPAFQSELNAYLQKWVNNNACRSISGTVYASEYDRQNNIMRVKIEVQFNRLVERVVIDLVVNK